ncbi:MAG: hypothetical protein Phog2KO_48030 [Phototrophicaceae bacterium]
MYQQPVLWGFPLYLLALFGRYDRIIQKKCLKKINDTQVYIREDKFLNLTLTAHTYLKIVTTNTI